MNDTVKRIMQLADWYALQHKFDLVNELNSNPTESSAFHRQVLESELTRLFTPLTDEQIEKIARGLPIDDYEHDLTRRVEKAHGIGEKQ